MNVARLRAPCAGTSHLFGLFLPALRSSLRELLIQLSSLPTLPPENFSDHLLRRHRTMMHMTFYWGRKMVLLFDSWKTDSWTSYSLSLLAVFLFSLFLQYMEDRRLRFKLLSSSSDPIGAPLLPLRPSGGKSSARFAVALLFGINSAIGYLLMLAVMSYNGGVFVAVVLGLAVGYLVFRSGEGELVLVESPCACA